jgi:hypothetical protein
VNLLVPGDVHPVDGRYAMRIEAWGYRWFRCGEPDPALDRSPEPPIRD